MQHIHLDTDFGGDPDDFAALLMLLGMPEVRLTGITTVLDSTGDRAGAVRKVLNHLGRNDIPLCAGAKMGLSSSETPGIRHEFWPDVSPLPPSEPGQSIATIERSMWMRSALVLIGPYTNGAMFERVRAGLLRSRRVVHMGGFIDPPAPGFPQWSAADDFNVQFDARAVQELYSSFADITMVPIPVAMNAWITDSDVDRVSRSGTLGTLLVAQLRTWADDQGWKTIGERHSALPSDLAGIMWDPLTALIATGWDGVSTETLQLTAKVEDGIVRFVQDPEDGRPVDVVTSFDGESFRETFLSAVERAQGINV